MDSDFTKFKKYQDYMSRETLKPAAAPFKGDLKQTLLKLDKKYRAVPYKTDSDTYGKDDYWATRQEMLKNGGDCEDYVNAIYSDLMELGVPPDQVYNVVGLLGDGRVHSMLQAGDYVLDQRAPGLLSPKHLQDMRQVYRINRNGWEDIQKNNQPGLLNPAIK
jgi:predicted transglutaminase-like cysteine proteinase